MQIDATEQSCSRTRHRHEASDFERQSMPSVTNLVFFHGLLLHTRRANQGSSSTTNKTAIIYYRTRNNARRKARGRSEYLVNEHDHFPAISIRSSLSLSENFLQREHVVAVPCSVKEQMQLIRSAAWIFGSTNIAVIEHDGRKKRGNK